MMTEVRKPDFETRVEQARKCNLALYLDDPSPESARLLVQFEETVEQLRYGRELKDTQPIEVPVCSMAGCKEPAVHWTRGGASAFCAEHDREVRNEVHGKPDTCGRCGGPGPLDGRAMCWHCQE